MKEILTNLALLDLLNFCKENKIDCSDTHIVKEPKPFTYSLNKSKLLTLCPQVLGYIIYTAKSCLLPCWLNLNQ